MRQPPNGGLSYSLSTLATIVADFRDNLSPKTAAIAENVNSRRFRRQYGHWTGLN